MAHDDGRPRDGVPDGPLTGEFTPAPDAPATAAEAARASSFAALVGDMLADRRAPPALDADARALVETAAIIRASAGRGFALADHRVTAVIDAAIARGAGARAPVPAHDELASAGRARRAAPWLVAAAAVAAAFVLALRPAPPRAVAATPAPAAQRSRPADPLIGPIARADAGGARARLDVIYADRMAGFRALRLSDATAGAARAQEAR